MQKTRRILFWINPNLHQHLHRNLTPPRLGYKWLTYKHGRRNSEGFFQSVAKRFFFQGLATVVKFNFINSETKSKAFFCWNVISKMSNFEMNGVPWHPPSSPLPTSVLIEPLLLSCGAEWKQRCTEKLNKPTQPISGVFNDQKSIKCWFLCAGPLVEFTSLPCSVKCEKSPFQWSVNKTSRYRFFEYIQKALHELKLFSAKLFD